MDIRRGCGEDAEAVIDLLKLFPSEGKPYTAWAAMKEAYLRLVNDHDQCSIFVAEKNGLILGIITLSYPMAIRCCGRYTCIEEFIVSPEGRGRGVGGALLEAALAEARSRGCYEL